MLYMLAIWLALREDAITQGLQMLKSEGDSKVRFAVLDNLQQYDGIRDIRILNYYRLVWKEKDIQNRNLPATVLMDELARHHYYSKEIKSLMIEFIGSEEVAARFMLPYLYRIRSLWWKDRQLVDLLNSKLKNFYHQVWDEAMSPHGKNAPLGHWIDMCRFRALTGDQSMLKVYEDNFYDKREIQDLRNLADPLVPIEPVPSRVCDYMLLSALKLGQVDVPALFAQYGYREIPRSEYPEKLIALYDQLIRDFPSIKKRYLCK